MKKAAFLILSFFFALQLNAQHQEDTQTVGAELTIKSPSSSAYKHLYFPRKNIIIKRGGIANFKSVVGTKVVISKILKKDNGVTEVVLKRADGRKFFNYLPNIKANLDQALAMGELAPYGR